MSKPQRTHDQKMVLILELVCDNGQTFTRLGIGRALGYESAQPIIMPLEELVAEGYVERREETRLNGSIRYTYHRNQAGCELIDRLRERWR